MFLFFIVAVFLLNPHLLLITSQPSGYYKCGFSFKYCGNYEYIEYPFYWENPDSEYYCGYPGLSVKCSEGERGRPILTISNHSYYYRQTNELRIRLTDIDTADQRCPQPRYNFSLEEHVPSSLITGGYNITLFYNCSSLPKDVEPNLPCMDNKYSNNASRRSFAMDTSRIPMGFNWYGNCQHKVTLPAYPYYPVTSYTEVIKQGIPLWMQPTNDCRNCEKSGGRCTYNRNSTSLWCSCKHGKLFGTSCPNDVPRNLIIVLLAGIGGSLLTLLFVCCWRCSKNSLLCCNRKT